MTDASRPQSVCLPASIRRALSYGADARWAELGTGSDFTVIDRQMLTRLHELCNDALEDLLPVADTKDS